MLFPRTCSTDAWNLAAFPGLRTKFQPLVGSKDIYFGRSDIQSTITSYLQVFYNTKYEEFLLVVKFGNIIPLY